jgi:NTE family protein
MNTALSDDGSDALVLSGGGAYAAYEVGVIKALVAGESSSTNHAPLDPAILTGTSAGAFNAAALVSLSPKGMREACEALERVWLRQIARADGSYDNGVYRNRLDPRRWLGSTSLEDFQNRTATAVTDFAHVAGALFDKSSELFLSQDSWIDRSLSFLDVAAVLSAEPFADVVRSVIQPGQISASRRALRIVATEWTTGRIHVFRNEDMAGTDAFLTVTASAAIPGFFPPIRMRGTEFVDGGVIMNTPLQPAIEAGGRTIHVVYLDPDVRNIDVSRLTNLVTVLDRVLLLSRADILEKDINIAARINRELEFADRFRDVGVDRLFDPASVAMNPGKKEVLRRVSIHRYHPTDDFGGFTGLLDVSQARIERLIQRGYHDAATHDCFVSGCVTAETQWGLAVRRS